jgi:hypothetical protein
MPTIFNILKEPKNNKVNFPKQLIILPQFNNMLERERKRFITSDMLELMRAKI